MQKIWISKEMMRERKILRSFLVKIEFDRSIINKTYLYRIMEALTEIIIITTKEMNFRSNSESIENKHLIFTYTWTWAIAQVAYMKMNFFCHFRSSQILFNLRFTLKLSKSNTLVKLMHIFSNNKCNKSLFIAIYLLHIYFKNVLHLDFNSGTEN